MSLTLGVHALQGYSSCVCVCACVRLDYFKQCRIGQEDLQIASALQSLDLKRGIFVNSLFMKIQNSSGSRIGALVGHFACSRRHLSVYPFM